MIKNTSLDIAKHLLISNNVSRRDNRMIRGSSAGRCKREIGYSLLGYQQLPNSGHSQVILDLGNALHDLLQRKLVAMGWIKAKPTLNDDGSIDWEQTDDPYSGCELTILNHDIRLIGHCDGVTVPLAKTVVNGKPSYYPDEKGERYLIEIKSITDRPNFWMLGIKDGGTSTIREDECQTDFIDIGYEESKSSGKFHQKFSRFQHSRKVIQKHGGVKECPVYKLNINGKDELVTVLMSGNSLGAFSTLSKPKSEHITQASLYADQMGISKVLFLYIGKDVDSRNYFDGEDLFNLPIKIFEHEVDELDIEMIKSKFKTIYESVDNNELPFRDYNLDSNECKYCNYRHICWPGEFDILKINKQLLDIGLKEVCVDPGVVHTPKISLVDDYSSNEKVI